MKFDEVMEQLQDFTISACDAEVEEVDAKTGSFTGFNDMKPKVIRVDFGRLPEGGRERSKAIMENGTSSSAHAMIYCTNEKIDSFLYSIISLLPTNKYTLIYTSTPLSLGKPHVSPYSNHELRRRDDHKENNTTLPEGSLFKRYQFFTTGIFLGYLVLFFLLSILYVGFNALSSLEVTYGAFEKEMGPAAAKKQQ